MQNKKERPPKGTLRPEKVAQAKKRTRSGFYEQEPVVNITVERLLEAINKAT